ncbi:MAG: DUF6514 family protein [Clostridiales bacterium]|nr:DUF6514 family protein [Clostridiales bacterium]
MNILCSETVSIDFTDYEVKYGFETAGESGEAVYGFIAELYEKGKPVGKAEERISGGLAEAVKLYGLLIKNKVTPVDLKYVIEDFT